MMIYLRRTAAWVEVNLMQLYGWVLMGIAFSLSFPRRFSAYLIFLLGLLWLLKGLPKIFARYFTNPTAQLLSSVFWLSALGLFFSQDRADSVFLLDKQISLFLLPAYISTLPLIRDDMRQKVLLAFVAGVGVVAVYLNLHTVWQLWAEGSLRIFNEYYGIWQEKDWWSYGMFMPSHVQHGHVTFSMYTVFALVIIAHQLRENPLLPKIPLILLAGYLIFFLTQLSAKNAFALFLIFAIFEAFHYYIKYKKHSKSLVLIGIASFFITLLVFIYQYSSLPNRLRELQSVDMQSYTDAHADNSIAQRIGIYTCSWEVLSDHWLVGVGSTDAQKLLNHCYENKGLFEWARRSYHSHNQFIHQTISFGVLGITLFLLIFAYPIVVWGLADRVAVSFLVIFYMGCATDNLLSINKGIVFFAFFYSLFFVRPKIVQG